MNLIEYIHALQNLETDPALVTLEHMLDEFDAFAFLGISGSEEIHSKIIAWLLNPRGSHAMGESFLVKFLRKAKAVTTEEIREIDWSTTDVHREWRNVVDGQSGFLDILVLNRNARYLCAIENKVFSSEHSEQLTRYRKALEKEFENLRKSHVFLTRHGLRPRRIEEQRFWTSVDYGMILKLVNDAINHDMAGGNDDVVAFLKQYARTLRRVIVPNTELRQMANRLYFTHRQAINLIIDQRDAHLAELRGLCTEALERHKIWDLIGERNGGTLLGFCYKGWRKFEVFNTGTNLSKSDPPYLLLLDFDFRNEGSVTLLLTIMESEREGVRKSLFEKTKGRYPKIFNHRGDPRGASYGANTIRLFRSEPILSESDFVDKDSVSWSATINAWVSEFTKKDFPKMNRILLENLQEIEAEQGYQQRSAEEA